MRYIFLYVMVFSLLTSGCVYQNPVRRYSVITYQTSEVPVFQTNQNNIYFSNFSYNFDPFFTPIPPAKLQNIQSLRRKQTHREFQEAYKRALSIVTPLSGSSQKDQLIGIARSLRKLFNENGHYSTSEMYYNTPYGFFVGGVASCAGATRATGLCLNILGIQYVHMNENKWKHQWCRIIVDNEVWAVDPFGMYVGPESTYPYRE